MWVSCDGFNHIIRFDNNPSVVPWLSAGRILNKVSGSLLSSRALDRGLLSSRTTYSIGGRTLE